MRNRVQSIFLFFRKEDRINRLERDLAEEKRKSERLLENMVKSKQYSILNRDFPCLGTGLETTVFENQIDIESTSNSNGFDA